MTTTLPTLQNRPAASRLGAARAEALKLTSLTSMRVAMPITLVAGASGALLQSSLDPSATSALLGSTVFSSAVIAIIGAVAASSEYATGTIQPSLMAVPRRLRLLATKKAVVAAFGAGLALLSAVLGVAVTGVQPELALVVPVLTCGLSGAAVGAFAALFGMFVRGSAPSVAGVLGVFILVPGLFGAIRLGNGGYLSDYTLGEAGGGLLLAADGAAWAQDLVILLAWVGAAGLGAALRLARADA